MTQWLLLLLFCWGLVFHCSTSPPLFALEGGEQSLLAQLHVKSEAPHVRISLVCYITNIIIIIFRIFTIFNQFCALLEKCYSFYVHTSWDVVPFDFVLHLVAWFN